MVRPQPRPVRTSNKKDGTSAAATSAPKMVSTPGVCQDGRELYLGSPRQQAMSGLFCLLLLFAWVAIVLTHVKGHAEDAVPSSLPSHSRDYPIPAEDPTRIYAALADDDEGAPRKNSTTAPTRTTATVRRRAPTTVTAGWESFDLQRLFARKRTVPAPSYTGQDMEVPSERKKILWCVYNGSDARFAPRHLPRHLCSTVVLCCLTLSAPSGEPSAAELHFAEFLKLRDKANRPNLLVALGGPQQDRLVLRSLVQGKRGNATLRLAVNVVHFVEFNRLDGVLLYTLQCGPDTVTVFRALHERLDFGGYIIAVTCPEEGEGRRLFADAGLGPVVLIPPQVNASSTQCPIGLGRRGVLQDQDARDVMLGVRLSGVRYKLPPGGGSAAQEGATASLIGSAAYRDVCLAIREHGWSGYGTLSGECVVAHRNRTWMAALTPWALDAAARLVGHYSGAGAVVLDVDADDVRGVCGSQPFPLTDALHRLL
ncbi:uncharacterized protein LOC144108087 [Amblyomma americanum]